MPRKQRLSKEVFVCSGSNLMIAPYGRKLGLEMFVLKQTKIEVAQPNTKSN